MTGKRIDIILVKLCAVIIVVLSLQSITSFLAYYINAPNAGFLATAAIVLTFVLPMLIAAALWTFPATIVGQVSASADDDSAELDWVVISVTLISLYVLVFGVIDLVYYESFRIAEREYLDPEGRGFYTPSPESAAGRITNIVQIVIGLLLLAGKRGIARLIRAARYKH